MLAGVLFVLIPMNPLNMPIVNRDSGMFAYMGSRILKGEIPYRDVWDHKPPLVYFLNAIGLATSDNTMWGFWVIEVLSLFTAIYISYRLFKRIFGKQAAIISSGIWLFTLILLLEGGNYTTEYTLPLQFIAIGLMVAPSPNNKPYRTRFIIGLLGGTAFYFKQTAAGVWIAYWIYLTIKDLRQKEIQRWLNDSLSLAVGPLMITVGLVVYFATNSGLGDFWDAAFRYNFVYKEQGISWLVKTMPILVGSHNLAPMGLLPIGLLGFVFAGIALKNRKISDAGMSLVLAVAVIDLPVELLLVSTSGRMYPHYYLTAIPVLAIFSAFLIWTLVNQLLRWNIPQIDLNQVSLLVLAVLLLGSVKYMGEKVYEYQNFGNRKVVKFIRENTSPTDTILVWGAETEINFASLRKSPARITSYYPLLSAGYASEEVVTGYLTDIMENKPRFVFDINNSGTPLLQLPNLTELDKSKVNEILANYGYQGTVGEWGVYERIVE